MRIGWLVALMAVGVLLTPPTIRAEDDDEVEVKQRATVHLRDFRFDPPAVTFTAGAGAELTLVNEGSVVHEFVIPSFHDMTVTLESGGVTTETMGVVELELAPKSTARLRFTPDKAGEYPFACHAMKPKDHFKAGMTGLLTIKSSA